MEFSIGDIKEWLDGIAKNMEQRKALAHFNNQIYAYDSGDWIQIEGAGIVADILGLKMIYDGRFEEYHRYYFVYRGVKFLHLTEEEE